MLFKFGLKIFYLPTILSVRCFYSNFLILIIFTFALTAYADSNYNTVDHHPTFQLIGTIISSNNQNIALIKQHEDKVRIYTTGDNINGFTLKAIQKNKIQLGIQNKIYTLFINNQLHSTEVQPHKNSQISSSSQHLPIELEISRNSLAHISDNIQPWLAAVPLKLILTDGRVSGYKVEAVRALPISSTIGLQKGDIIRSVNGISVGQSKAFAQIVNNLKTNSDIYIEVERGHKTNKLHFKILD